MEYPSQKELAQLNYQKEKDAFVKTTVWSVLLANLLMLLYPPLFIIGLLIPWGWTRPIKPSLRAFDCDMNYHITIWGNLFKAIASIFRGIPYFIKRVEYLKEMKQAAGK